MLKKRIFSAVCGLLIGFTGYTNAAIFYGAAAVQDLNQDQASDLVVFSIPDFSSKSADLIAFSGKDGSMIWQKKDLPFGQTLDAGDLNGDGVSDLAIAAIDAETLYFRSGQNGDLIGSFTKPAPFNPNWPFSLFAFRAINLGDVDGDQRNDFAVSTVGGYDLFPGFVSIVSSGNLDPQNFLFPHELTSFSTSGYRLGKDESHLFGNNLEKLHYDYNGDGLPEFLVGEPRYLDMFLSGKVYVLSLQKETDQNGDDHFFITKLAEITNPTKFSYGAGRPEDLNDRINYYPTNLYGYIGQFGLALSAAPDQDFDGDNVPDFFISGDIINDELIGYPNLPKLQVHAVTSRITLYSGATFKPLCFIGNRHAGRGYAPRGLNALKAVERLKLKLDNNGPVNPNEIGAQNPINIQRVHELLVQGGGRMYRISYENGDCNTEIFGLDDANGPIHAIPEEPIIDSDEKEDFAMSLGREVVSDNLLNSLDPKYILLQTEEAPFGQKTGQISVYDETGNLIQVIQ